MAGLGEAHAQGVVHRDLKPENIQIARDGTVRVMDFGIARSLETGGTQTGTIIGTPAYMSPEQAQGQRADHRSDYFRPELETAWRRLAAALDHFHSWCVGRPKD